MKRSHGVDGSRAVQMFLALAILVLGVCSVLWLRQSERVRVVLITLDTLRYDSFAGVEGRGSTMPHLRRWAEEATIFDRFYTSTASTQPSHASMFTGLHPWQHGVSRNGMELSETYRTVSEQLRNAGFATSAVVASFPLSQRFGFGQGFDSFHDQFATGQVSAGEWLDAAQQAEADGDGSQTQPGDPFYSLADHVVAQAQSELDAATAQRQFYWFHFFDPHSPYGDTTRETTINPTAVLELAASGKNPAEALARARRLYDADVTFLDTAVARLLQRLEQDASRFETHIVIVADHGESFGEDGSMAHGRRLIPSQIHVPCIIRSPRFGSGIRHDVASSIDIAATLLALAGVHRAPEPGSESRDLTQPPRRPRRAFGMRRTYEEPFVDRRLDGSVHMIEGYLFYLLSESSGLFLGNSNVLIPPAGNEASAEEARRLRALFSGFEKDLARNEAGGDFDPEVEEGLRALGYTD